MLNWFRTKPPFLKKTKVDSPKVDPSGKPMYQGLAPKERWDQIEFVFESGGVNYFKFNSDVNIPFQRAVAARDILTEELWQINPDQLKAWVNSLISVVTDEKRKHDKKIFEIGVLAHRLKEQLDMSFSLTRQLKLASVLYFDEKENPLDYQYPYNQDKIKHWMANNDVPDFFLRLPEYTLMPSGRELAQSFPTYLQGETMARLKDLTHIISIMSMDNSDNDMKKELQSQMEILNDINLWSKGQFTNTTSSTTIG
jgi:hypothetical protein